MLFEMKEKRQFSILGNSTQTAMKVLKNTRTFLVINTLDSLLGKNFTLF